MENAANIDVAKEPALQNLPELGESVPPLLVAGLVTAVGIALAASLLVFDAPLVAVGFLGAIGLIIAAGNVELAILCYLVLRPLMRVIPEFQVAGQTVGVDGFLNTFLAGACLLALPFRRRSPIAKPYVWFYAALLAIAVVSLRLSLDPVLGERQIFRFFTYMLFFWIAYTASSETFAKRLVWVMTMALTILILLGVLQTLLMLRDMSWHQYLVAIAGEGSTGKRISGYQGLPHTYSNLIIVLMPAVLWLAWHATSLVPRLVFYGLLGAALTMIVVSGVRSALIAFAAMLVVFFVGQKQYRFLAALLLLFIALGFGTGMFQSRIERFVKPTASIDWNSMVERRESWAILTAATKQQPFKGYGIGTVEQFLAKSPQKHSSRPIAAHSDFRKFAFETGLPGFFCYAAFWGSILYACWRRRGTLPLGRYLCTAAAATGAAWMAIALVDEMLQSFLVMTMWFVLAGTGLGLIREPNAEVPVTPDSPAT